MRPSLCKRGLLPLGVEGFLGIAAEGTSLTGIGFALIGVTKLYADCVLSKGLDIVSAFWRR